MSLEKKREFYFGWWVVVACFLLMAFLYAPGTTLVGLHVAPLAAEFKTSTTASSFLITLSMFTSMIGASFAGRMCTKHGTRKVVSIMLIVVVIGYAGLALSPGIYVACVFSAIRGFGLVFVTIIPMSMMVTTWFGKKVVGKALGIAGAGSGIGAMTLSPIVAKIIESMGWRIAYGMYAILAAVCIPLVLACFSPSPAAKGLARLGDDPEETAAAASSGDAASLELAGGRALKSAIFWFAMLGAVTMSITTQGWINLAPTFYAGLDIDALTIGTLISVTALVLTVAKIAFGAICDKFGAKVGIALSLGCIVACYVLAIVADTNVIVTLAFVCSALIGFGQTMPSVVLPLIVKDLFGQKDYGTIFGYLNTGVYLGASFGPLALAMLLDGTGAFAVPFATALAFIVFAFIAYMAAYGLRKGGSAKNETA
jgi:MFS family permease